MVEAAFRDGFRVHPASLRIGALAAAITREFGRPPAEGRAA